MSEPETSPSSFPVEKESPAVVNTKKLILGLVVLAVLTVGALLVIFTLPVKKAEKEESTRQVQNPFEETAVNPFSEETNYQNPFESTESDQEYQNPFEELR